MHMHFESESLDPRLQPDPRVKRPRLIDHRSDLAKGFAGFGGPVGTASLTPAPVAVKSEPVEVGVQDSSRASGASSAPVFEDPLSARIVDTLQRLLPPNGVSVPPRVPPEPELGSLLLDSLRNLLPAGGESAIACQGSEAGQMLLRVVQESTPQPARDPRVKRELRPTTSLSATDLEKFVGNDGEPIRLPPANVDPSALEEEELRSGDGVPHRLPPGFGAIPEDLVEERARQREEERIRRIKATQPCRFGRVCRRRDCMNAHPDGREIDTQLNLCAFGRRCKRKNCFYDHPDGREIDDDPSKGACKFGKKCRNPDCLYDHPEGRDPVAGTDLRVCYFCHDAGHLATDCPQNPESWAYSVDRERERRLANSETPALTNGPVPVVLGATSPAPPRGSDEATKA
uniref:CCHC-type domain-containing protein n=1 Tax=Noctiluca scintillans TaxID=2966 RepID=A0A7S1A4Z8_NOCSC|mmetsp:Transcript_32011/g.85733  ORF Transcript_32011/g.85733 Transcript_32011/m.85733 type:complete len:401 (+) Transcript_32011:137-1339(+)